MRFLVDIDDTISFHTNRDYANATPNAKVIDKLRELKSRFPDCTITLFTSRGMASCKGDVQLADQKNRPILEQWLARYDVPCDEIIFGKPLADFYIDDKGLNAEEFGDAKLGSYSGFSGSKVSRVGRYIIKEAENAQQQYGWYKQAREIVRPLFKTPKMISCTLNHLTMEYVEGELAADVVDARIVERLLAIARQFSQAEDGTNNVQGYIDFIQQRQRDTGLTGNVVDAIADCRYTLERRTFCHGDYSLLNAIVTTNKAICLIDPSPKDISTWLLDVAKLRASIRWLDKALVGTEHDERLVRIIDNQLSDAELKTVKVLEKTHLIRVMYYAIKLGKDSVQKELAEAYERLE